MDLLKPKYHHIGALAAQIDDATSDVRLGPDYALFMAICDGVNALPDSGAAMGEVVDVLRRRLREKGSLTLLIALQLVEACSKNCGVRLLRAMGGDARFLEQLRDVAKATARKAGRDMTDAHNKCLELVQTWGEEFLPLKAKEPSLGGFVALYHDLRKQGYRFPMAQMDEARPPVLTPPAATQAHATGGATGGSRAQHPALKGELGMLAATVDMVEQMLGVRPTPAELRANDAAGDMVAILRANEAHLVAAIDRSVTVAPEAVETLLALNDRLHAALDAYDRLLAGMGPAAGGGGVAARGAAAAAPASPAAAHADLLGLASSPAAAAAPPTRPGAAAAAAPASARPIAAAQAQAAAAPAARHAAAMSDDDLFAAFEGARLGVPAASAPAAAPAPRPAAAASGAGAPALGTAIPLTAPTAAGSAAAAGKAKVPLLRPPPGAGPAMPAAAAARSAAASASGSRRTSSAAGSDLDDLFGGGTQAAKPLAAAMPADPFAPVAAASAGAAPGSSMRSAPHDPFAATGSATAAADPFAPAEPVVQRVGATAAVDPFAAVPGPAPATVGRAGTPALSGVGASAGGNAPSTMGHGRRDSASAVTDAFGASMDQPAGPQMGWPAGHAAGLPPRPGALPTAGAHMPAGGHYPTAGSGYAPAYAAAGYPQAGYPAAHPSFGAPAPYGGMAAGYGMPAPGVLPPGSYAGGGMLPHMPAGTAMGQGASGQAGGAAAAAAARNNPFA